MKKAKATQEAAVPVHPAAAIFPMMTDEELDILAADIKANGQIHPIIIDDDEQLIDGRNRYEACKRAGVVPRFDKLNGHDTREFILSANINRRHMTAGQRAMATAMMYPEAEKGGKGKTSKALEAKGFSSARLSQARTVLRYSLPLAEAVMAGTKFLDAAYTEAKQQTAVLQSSDERLKRLREKSPDLAQMVDEERLTIAAAEAEIAERARMEQEARDNARKSAAVLQSEIIGHVATVMAGMQLGETKLFERKKIAAAIEAMQTMIGDGR